MISGRFVTKLCMACVTLAIVAYAAQATFTGRITAVNSGDAFTVKTTALNRQSNTEQVGVRIFGIASPATGTDYSQDAMQYLSDLCLEKNVSVSPVSSDSQGNLVANVTLGRNTDLAEAMVRSGYAWWRRDESPDNDTLEKLEAAARKAQRGLWAGPNPTPPWEVNRVESPTVADPARDTVFVTSSDKTYHRGTCRLLKKNPYRPMGRQAAIDQGYKACTTCLP